MQVGDKVLITTDNWFFAPDGESYRAVWGTVNGILNDEQALGIKTNARSTNWFVSIGNMVVAGCQIHYAIKTDSFSNAAPSREVEHDGKVNVLNHNMTRIYNADK
jgi:hypothetical protein